MIKNFKELEAAYIAKDMDMSREEFITTLKEKEREALRSEVKTWG